MKDRLKDLLRDDPAVVFFMALGAAGLGLLAVLLALQLRLEACHLCIFQRLVYFLIGASLFVAFAVWEQFALRIGALLSAGAFNVWGLCIAAQQSWLQWFPYSGLDCTISNIGMAERFIDELGRLHPVFFMATGSCANKDLVVLGLSLANWSFLILLAFLAGCLRVIARTMGNRNLAKRQA